MTEMPLYPTGYDAYAPTYAWTRSAVPWVVAPLARIVAAEFPSPSASGALAFAVDVVHHVSDLSSFFAEACRVLLPGGFLVVVTDSERTLTRRSLTGFFPEILAIERTRYPAIARLHQEAHRGGLQLAAHEEAVGWIPLNGEFLHSLEAKCASAMRIITADQHAAGMTRVRAAAARGERWLSCYEVVCYVREDRTPTAELGNEADEDAARPSQLAARSLGIPFDQEHL